MKAKSFEQQTYITRLEGLKDNLKLLRDDYRKVQEDFDNLCDELDNHVINENYLYEVSSKLTVYISEMNLIEQNIKEISRSIKKIKDELCN
jgi:uncharacterized protein (UPF0335 family)